MKKTFITIAFALAALVTPSSAKAADADLQSQIFNDIMSYYIFLSTTLPASHLPKIDATINTMLAAAATGAPVAPVTPDQDPVGETSAGSRR